MNHFVTFDMLIQVLCIYLINVYNVNTFWYLKLTNNNVQKMSYVFVKHLIQWRGCCINASV